MDEKEKLSAEYQARYREAPEDVLEHCCGKVAFLTEVVANSHPGEGLPFSDEATHGLFSILRGIRYEMRDCLAEMAQQRKDRQ